MKHGRADYDERIQDSAGKIPEDEPVFLLRGQDPVAWRGLEMFIQYSSQQGVAIEMLESMHQQVNRMREWSRTHPKQNADL